MRRHSGELLTTFYLLLTSYYLLRTTYYVGIQENYLLLTTHYSLLATYYLLLTTGIQENFGGEAIVGRATMRCMCMQGQVDTNLWVSAEAVLDNRNTEQVDQHSLPQPTPAVHPSE